MNYAGTYSSFSAVKVRSVPTHDKGKGFDGTFDLLINADGSITLTESPKFYIIHGYFLWFAWGLLGFLQILSTRHIKQYWKTAMWIHRISGVINMLITFILSLLAYNYVNWK